MIRRLLIAAAVSIATFVGAFQVGFGEVAKPNSPAQADNPHAARWVHQTVSQNRTPAPEKSADAAANPTLEQTAAYILNGGFIELSDMRQADGKLYLSAYVQLGLMAQIPASIMSVADRDNCELEVVTGLKQKARYLLNNVIVAETTYEDLQTRLERLTELVLVGENHIACQDWIVNGCYRRIEITAKSDSLPRIAKAMDYLYSNYCKAARRTRPF